MDHAEIEDSRCYECHGPQNADYVWDAPFQITIDGLPSDDGIMLRAGILNTWKASLHELSIEIDLTDAPGVRFDSGIPPMHLDETSSIHVDAAAFEFDPATVTGSRFGATSEHVAWVPITLPPGATEATLRVAPVDGRANLRLLLNGSLEPDRTAHRIDAAGPGQAETLRLDAQAIAALGVGRWWLGAAVQPVGDGVDPHHGDVPFRYSADAWVNSTDRVQFAAIDGPLLPQGRGWSDVPLLIDGDEPQTIAVTARLRMHYDHTNSANPDDGMLMQTILVPIHNNTLNVATQPVIQRPDTLPTSAIAEAIGYAATFLMVASMISGGVLGKASRRSLNRIFGTARRRVAFHNFLSYGLLGAAIAHLWLFIAETAYHWTVGLLWGGASIVCLMGLAVTGAVQVPIIRAWGHKTWRWVHLGFAIATLAFLGLHLFLDGANLSIADEIGWEDPLVPRDL